MCVDAGIGRQQRRVNIDQLAAVALDEMVGEDAHEARQCDHVGRMAVYRCGQCGIEGCAVRIVPVRHDGGRDAVRLGDLQSLRIGAVADDRRDAAGQVRLQQRLHVAATAGDEDDDVFHSLADLGLVLVAVACADDADARYRFAGRLADA